MTSEGRHAPCHLFDFVRPRLGYLRIIVACILGFDIKSTVLSCPFRLSKRALCRSLLNAVGYYMMGLLTPERGPDFFPSFREALL
jgi:hypothetical protein